MTQSRTRAKRRILDSSDNEEEVRGGKISTRKSGSVFKPGQGASVATLPARPNSKQTTLSFQQSATASPSSSAHSTPRKKPQVRDASINGARKVQSKEIYSFFNAATQKQQRVSRSPGRGKDIDLEIEDQIEDDILPDVKSRKPLHDTEYATLAQSSRKRSWDVSNAGSNHSAQSFPGQKLFKSLNGIRTSPPAADDSHTPAQATRSWPEEYAPTSLDQLAVHPKKVADVRKWLEGFFNRQLYQRLLVLKGAAGTGKTATVSLLAKQLGCVVSEWKAPNLAEFGSGSYVSLSAQFEEFLFRAGKYRGLELVQDSSSLDSEAKYSASSIENDERQIVLVEDFPDTAGSSFTALQSFRSSVLGFLAASAYNRSTSSSKDVVPLVMVISESTVSNGNSSDSFTAHRILGPEIMHHPGTTVIEFNAVAPTFVTKALKLTLEKHAKQTSKMYRPDAEVIKKIAEIGDIRNALSALELVCTQLIHSTELTVTTNGRNKATKSKSGSKTKGNASTNQSGPTTNALLASLPLREGTLGLFHTVGKVVYNKRDEDALQMSNSDDHSSSMVTKDSLPPLSLDLDALHDSTGIDVSTFLSSLHENYLPSCVSPSNDSEATLNSILGSLDALGDGDILGNFHTNSRYGNRTAAEGLRQEEFAFQTTVRGIMKSLPFPVKRQNIYASVTGRSNDKREAHKMFYPTSIKLWRRQDEIQSLVDMFATRALNGQLTAGLPMGVYRRESESREIDQPGRMPPPPVPSDVISGTGSTVPQDAYTARSSLLFETLPYLALCLAPSSRPSNTRGSLQKELEQITRFTGLGIYPDEEADEDDTPSEVARKVKNAFKINKKADVGDDAADLGVEQLILSDDDIEDDGV